MLQNCHLLPKWLKTLEKILDKLEKPHKVHLWTLNLCVCMHAYICALCVVCLWQYLCASISVIHSHAVVYTDSACENDSVCARRIDCFSVTFEHL